MPKKITDKIKYISIIIALKDYKKNHKDRVSDYVYKNILYDFNKYISNKLVEGNTITLPERMGVLYVRGRKTVIKYNEQNKPCNLPVNWKKTKENWENNPEDKKNKKLIFFTNIHSNFFRFKFYWSRSRVFVTNKNLYSFIPTRQNKRSLAKKINENHEIYKVI